MKKKRVGRPANTKDIPEGAMSVLKQKKFTPCRSKRQVDGKKKKYKQITNGISGYDICELLIVVIPYVTKKHSIKEKTLLTILYLFKINYITIEDYNEIPSEKRGATFKYLKENGFFDAFIYGRTLHKSVYILSDKSKKIVYDFYQLLGGEKKMDPKVLNINTVNRVGMLKNKKNISFIQKVNAMEHSDEKKSLYQ